MFLPFKENEPRPQQPPLFSDVKKSPSLATYVCTLALVSRVLNSQRPTISSFLLGCPPSLAKLRKATEYSSLFVPNK